MLTPRDDPRKPDNSASNGYGTFRLLARERAALPPLRSIFTNVLITLLAIALSVVALEGLVRWFALAPPPAAAADQGLKTLVTFDQTLETRYIPNVSTRIASPWKEYDVTYRTNQLGLRGGDVPAKQPGELRVLAVGNSFVEGWGVEENQTFTRVAENVLRSAGEKADPARSVRIVNGGISGYGAAQVNLNSRRLWPAVAPDVVLLAYIGTMVSADSKYLKSAAKDRDGIAQGLSADAVLQGGSAETAEPISRLMSWMAAGSRWSALLRLVHNRLANEAEINRIRIGDPNSDLLAAYRSDSDAQRMLQPTLQHVSALADFSRKNGARFILLYLPMPFQLSDQAWDQGRKAYRLSGAGNGQEREAIASFCTAQKLDCLFPDDVLREAISREGARSIYYSYDFHLTVEGNRVLGAWLGAQIGQVLRSGKQP
jgi:hypothetical protein